MSPLLALSLNHVVNTVFGDLTSTAISISSVSGFFISNCLFYNCYTNSKGACILSSINNLTVQYCCAQYCSSRDCGMFGTFQQGNFSYLSIFKCPSDLSGNDDVFDVNNGNSLYIYLNITRCSPNSNGSPIQNLYYTFITLKYTQISENNVCSAIENYYSPHIFIPE